MTQVTWADIRQGDTIRADDGTLWHVEYALSGNPIVGSDMNLDLRLTFGIHDTVNRVEVTYPATAPVEKWDVPDPLTIEAVQTVFAPTPEQAAGDRTDAEMVEVLHELGAKLIAKETTEETVAHEAATAADPEVLPEILEPLMLRSHLYLVHGLSVSELPAGPEAGPMMTELHATSHSTGPMQYPHIHKPEGKR